MERLDKILTLLCAWLLFTMATAIFIQVLTRYVFHLSFPVLHYVIVMSMSWMTMLGAAVGLYRGEHFAMDMWSRRPPSPLKTIVTTFRDGCMLLTVITLIYGGWEFAALGLLKENPATEVSEVYGYSSVMVGAIIMLVFFVARLRKEMKKS